MATKMVYANGHLTDDAFVAGLEGLAPTTETTLMNLFQAYFVGLPKFTPDTNAIGAWIETTDDGDVLYLDPVVITWSDESAKELSKRGEQIAYFKAKGILYTENCDTNRLLFVLTRVAKRYGGATALKTDNNRWIVVACAGDVVYL